MVSTTIPTDALFRHIDLSEIPEWERDKYDDFFEYTDDTEIYANGASLEYLTELAHSVRGILTRCRSKVSLDGQTANQWELNHLSEVKQRLANAIEMKRGYYENHLFGIISKYVLIVLGRWNNGDTPAIVTAEDFLLYWDSRRPVRKISHPNNPAFGKYSLRPEFRIVTYDTTRYFNYNPQRIIEMASGEQVNYTSNS